VAENVCAGGSTGRRKKEEKESVREKKRKEKGEGRKEERGVIFVFASFLFFLSFDFFPFTLVVPTKEEREFGSGFFIF